MNLFSFIKENLYKDTAKLKLSLKQENFDFDLDFALMQIECRRKSGKKLQELLLNEKFLFPDSISAEQSSHQSIAKYHASIANGSRNILDMTAGLGVDTIAFAASAEKVTAIEMITSKAEVLRQNIDSLGLKNVRVLNDDSIKFLEEKIEVNKIRINTDINPDNVMTASFDLIFVDPARRDSSNKKVYNLRECSPDIISSQSLLLKMAPRILIKASPLLDISQTIKDFDKIKCIRTVGVKGECKEVLIEISEDAISGQFKLEAVNLDNDGNLISYFQTFSTEGNAIGRIDFIASEKEVKKGMYLLEPSHMLMKFAPWTELCNRFSAKKLGKSSHLFITGNKPDNFPGRVTIIESYVNKNSRKSLSGFPASVVSRNYPLSAEELRKSLKLKEGDKHFIYATRIGMNPVLLLTSLESETCGQDNLIIH